MRGTKTDSLMYLGVKGTVVALDRRTGVEAWRTELKGMDFVNVVLDDSALYATARGEVYCLDPLTGRIRWNNPLKGLGSGLITMAGESVVPMAQHRAAQAAAAAAAAT